MLKTDKPCYYGRRCYIRVIKGRSSLIAIKVLQTITGTSYVAQPNYSDNDVNLCNKSLTSSFDSDSFLVGVENHATKCMSNNSKHFVSLDPMKNRTVKGVGGMIRVLSRGTMCWRVEEDDSHIHNLDIK